MGSWQITVEPASEPVTLDEAREHLRNEDESFDDDEVTRLIVAARKYCEAYMNRVLITQTWRQNEDQWSNPVCLRVNPVISLTSLKYWDSDNNQQTITDNDNNFQKDFNSDVAAIYEGLVNTFPAISANKINPIEIITVCGYGDASDVPEDIKQAIKIMISYFYEHRDMLNVPVASIATQIEVPNAVFSLLTRYRVNVFA
jgi:uncharacterized phiE125 gp8 family phage protein